MTTYEKIVKGATKIKLAQPKPKYIEPILMATNNGINDEDFRTVMRALHSRLQDTAWTIVFKALIVSHLMIKEGDENTTIQYLSVHPDFFECKNISKTVQFGSNGGDIRSVNNYSSYLSVRSREFRKMNYDIIKENYNIRRNSSSWSSKDKNSSNNSRLRNLSVEKGLLRNVESVQALIDSLIRCKYQENEVNNEVLVLSFKMLVSDLLTLYQSLNEGIINILEHFFELSKPDCERALEIYKRFTKETTEVVAFLRVAKHLEYATKMSIPTIKHAQTGLTASLEEYLHDANFESNRRQYLAEKSSKAENGGAVAANKNPRDTSAVDLNTNIFAGQQQQLEQQQQLLQQQQFSQQYAFLPNMLTQQQIFTGTSPTTPQQTTLNNGTTSSYPFQQPQQQIAQPQQQQQQQQQPPPPQQQQQQQPQATAAGLSFQATGYNPFTQVQQQPVIMPQFTQAQSQPVVAQSQPVNLIDDFNHPKTLAPSSTNSFSQQQTGFNQPFGAQQQTQNQSYPFSTINGFSQQPNIPSQTTASAPLNTMFTGVGFGGYGAQNYQTQTQVQPQFTQQPQQQQQPAVTPFTQQQTGTLFNNPTGIQLPASTNINPVPLPTSTTSSAPNPLVATRTGNVNRTNTNPFAFNSTGTTSTTGSNNNPFSQGSFSAVSYNNTQPQQQPMVAQQTIPLPMQQQHTQQQQQQQQQQQPLFQTPTASHPLKPVNTGTNPFRQQTGLF